MDIGKKLKELRLQNDLTLGDLASRSELTKGFLSQVERNLTAPSIATLEDILEALGTNLSEFFHEEEEKQIVRQNIAAVKANVQALVKPEEILEIRKIVEKIYIDEKIEKYIVDIVFATRFPSDYGLNDLTSIISFGASPRASISMAIAARAYAFLRGRGYVIPEDVRAICHDVLRHRIGLSYEAEANNISADEVVSEILDKIAVP